MFGFRNTTAVDSQMSAGNRGIREASTLADALRVSGASNGGLVCPWTRSVERDLACPTIP